MATKGLVRVECPSCGESFDADFWTVVRGDRDHEVRELILNGEFDILMCPKCSVMFQHEEPFLYLDPSRDLLAFVMPETWLAEKDKWIAKMKADYEPVRAALSAGHGLSGLRLETRIVQRLGQPAGSATRQEGTRHYEGHQDSEIHISTCRGRWPGLATTKTTKGIQARPTRLFRMGRR